MKFFYRYNSIRTKLIVAILLSCTVLLVIGGGSFLVVEFYSSRIALEQEVRTLASSLAANSSQHLVLGKYAEIEKILSSLQRQRNIHAAYLFDAAAEPVAEYLNQRNPGLLLSSLEKDFKRGSAFVLPAGEQQVFDWKHLGSFVPVFFEDRVVGSIYLLSDLNELYLRTGLLASGFMIAFLLLLLASWLLARWIQGPISQPLLCLSEVMNRVSATDDYSLRAEKFSTDEVGRLVDGFNQMLGQIEQQQKRLTGYQQELEQTVIERTAALRETVGQLEQARKMADAANAAKSDFLSKMTHELRTPLIGVLGMNELLQRTSLDEQQQVLTTTVQKSGEGLLDLISDVLDLSRIEAGQLKLEPGPVFFHQIVEDAVQLLIPVATEKGLDIRTDIALGSTWQVNADENRIRQIVMNLLGNAVKFTPSGHIAVSLECTVQNHRQGLFTLRVTDTGIGMNDEVRARIFDLFYQSGHSATRTEQGSGLGLPIVRQLVELMDGEISLVSSPDQGSCFEIELSLPLIAESSFSLPEGLMGETVLLASDNAALRTLLKKRLVELGCQLDMAINADELWFFLRDAQKRSRPYPVLFVDESVQTLLHQPLYQALREVEGAPSQRIILLSADSTYQTALHNNETRLKLPLCWSRLCRAINLSWRGLHLVPSPSVNSVGKQKNNQEQIKFLLLGQQVASCELLRLLLLKKNIEVDLIANLENLPRTQGDNCRYCLLIDCPYSPEEELGVFFETCQHHFDRIILLSETALTGTLKSFGFQQLMKPLLDNDIDTVLKPLLAAATRSRAGQV